MDNQLMLAALTEWYRSEQGQCIYQFEAEQLARVLSDCYGYQLLQIGGPADLSWLSVSPIKHKIWLAPQGIDKLMPCPLIASPDTLPFAPNSIDVVILPHTLECHQSQDEVLQQAYDVLIPEGYLIVLGFNRMSLWGMYHYWHSLKMGTPFLPWQRQFIPQARLQRKLLSMGCVIDLFHVGYYLPPYDTQLHQQKWAFLELLGPMAWSGWGALYVIMAHKEVSTFTPVPTRWQGLSLPPTKEGLVTSNSELP